MPRYKKLTIGICIVFALCCYFVATQLSKSIMIQKVQHDLKEIMVIVDISYPGEWKSQNGLYKGEKRFNSDILGVEKLAGLSGTQITFFDKDTRVATTINGDNGEKILGTKANNEIIEKVLKQGQQYIGQVYINGDKYVCIYHPLKNNFQETVGMLYVGLPVHIIFDIQLNFVVYAIAFLFALMGVLELSEYIVSKY